jgi:hypothetical protein
VGITVVLWYDAALNSGRVTPWPDNVKEKNGEGIKRVPEKIPEGDGS